MNATTLPDAVLQALRASAVRAATGDTFDPAAQLGAIEIGFDVLPPDAALPYVVIGEPGERRTYFTAGPNGSRPYLADGTLAISCYDAARDSTLPALVASALHDNPPSWIGATMSTLRCVASQRVPMEDAGPEGSQTIFLTALQFTFQYQGSA